MSSTHYKKNVKCDDCHQGGHMTKKLIKSESLTICGKCHTTNQMLGNNGVHQVALKSGNKNAPTCVDCHGSHQILASKMSIESQSCLKCHLDEKLTNGRIGLVGVKALRNLYHNIKQVYTALFRKTENLQRVVLIATEII